MTAGIETLRLLRQPGVYEHLETKARQLCDGVQGAAKRAGVSVYSTRVGSMFCLLHRSLCHRLRQHQFCGYGSFPRYFHALLDAGIYVAPSQFEAGFVSTAHSADDIERTIEASYQAFQAVAKG